jgi:hypothetical protein
MVINNISDDTGIFMIFPGKKYFTSVNNWMTVGETINVSVQYDSFSDQIGVL